MTFQIEQKYIKNKLARPETKRPHTLFIVAHDTGNAGATADNHYKYFSNITFSASAHTFIDDKKILEIIPIDERAWHVMYDKPIDNRMFGDDANDAAVGVELCFGGSINFNEAYKRYVWYMAYLCKKYKLNPTKHIVGHYTLDPQRKTDPINAFKRYGITWNSFINDVVKEFEGKKEEPFMLEKAIVVNSFADFPAAEPLAGRLEAPIYLRGIIEGKKVSKELYVVGGTTDKLVADKVTLLSGADRYATAAAVKKFLG